jgi:uncharacterized protein YggT (Ycf19 family)
MLALLAQLVFWALELTIIVGIAVHMIAQLTGGRWARHPLVKTLLFFVQAVCAPVRQAMKAIGIPVSPIDFSPLLTIFVLRGLKWLIVGFLKFLP